MLKQINIKKLITASLIFYSIFLFAGIPSFINVFQLGEKQIIPDAKIIALSPAAFFLYAIGLAGIWVLYIGGIALLKGKPDAEKFARRRMLVGINFLGICLLGLEILLRIGYSAI